jgi:hypothetical protein
MKKLLFVLAAVFAANAATINPGDWDGYISCTTSVADYIHRLEMSKDSVLNVKIQPAYGTYPEGNDTTAHWYVDTTVDPCVITWRTPNERTVTRVFVGNAAQDYTNAWDIKRGTYWGHDGGTDEVFTNVHSEMDSIVYPGVTGGNGLINTISGNGDTMAVVYRHGGQSNDWSYPALNLSTDNGQTFGSPVAVTDSGWEYEAAWFLNDTVSVLVVDLPDRLTGTRAIARSTDWTNWTLDTLADSAIWDDWYSLPWGIVLSNDRVFVPMYKLPNIKGFYSDDNGKTWDTTTTMSGTSIGHDLTEWTVAEVKTNGSLNGQMKAVVRNGGDITYAGQGYFDTLSLSNYGSTWLTSVATDSTLTVNDNRPIPGFLRRSADGANIILAYGEENLILRESYDEGVTWRRYTMPIVKNTGDYKHYLDMYPYDSTKNKMAFFSSRWNGTRLVYNHLRVAPVSAWVCNQDSMEMTDSTVRISAPTGRRFANSVFAADPTAKNVRWSLKYKSYIEDYAGIGSARDKYGAWLNKYVGVVNNDGYIRNDSSGSNIWYDSTLALLSANDSTVYIKVDAVMTSDSATLFVDDTLRSTKLASDDNGVPDALMTAIVSTYGLAAPQYWVDIYEASAIPAYSVSTSTVQSTGASLITTHPSDQSIASGSTATYTVSASSDSAITYQWQRYTSSWANVSGATDSTYETDTLTTNDNGDSLRVIVEADTTIDTSNSALLTVSFAHNFSIIDTTKRGFTVVYKYRGSDSIFLYDSTNGSLVHSDSASKDTFNVTGSCYNTTNKLRLNHGSAGDTIVAVATLDAEFGTITYTRTKNQATRFPVLLLSNPADSCFKKFRGAASPTVDAYTISTGGDTTAHTVSGAASQLNTTGIWFQPFSQTEMNPTENKILWRLVPDATADTDTSRWYIINLQ